MASRSACHSSLNHGVKRCGAARSSASSAAGAIQRQFRDLGCVDHRLRRRSCRHTPSTIRVRYPRRRTGALVLEFVDEAAALRGRPSSCSRRRLNRDVDVFAGARVAAAAVRPEVRPQAFRRMALMDQQRAVAIEHEQRERPMQNACAVVARRTSTPCPSRGRAAVDEDQPLVLRRNDMVAGCARLTTACAATMNVSV